MQGQLRRISMQDMGSLVFGSDSYFWYNVRGITPDGRKVGWSGAASDPGDAVRRFLEQHPECAACRTLDIICKG
jgi:hypothetical protein